jgi:glycosyltransferase involved in cell wall biosynthesis
MKLSIITICLNEVENIKKTIRSVIDQTYKNYQYIVIDGGSIDGTCEVIRNFSEHIDVFISEPDDGIYNAMNKGLRKAAGEYIFFLNGGDILADSKVFEKVFNQNIFADIVYGFIQTNDGRTISAPKIITKKYLSERTIPHPSVITRRQLFTKAGCFDESFSIAGDYDFFVRAIIQYKASFQYIPILMAIFDINGISLSNPHLRDEEKKKVKNKYFGIGKKLFRLIKYYKKFRIFKL